MSRKTVAPNIAFDDRKNRYYLTLHYGMDRKGNRVKKTRCFPTLEQAILVRDNFLTARDIRGSILPSGVTVLYNNIPGPKKIKYIQGADHGFNPPGAQVFEMESK